jgi:hypothetical protein
MHDNVPVVSTVHQGFAVINFSVSENIIQHNLKGSVIALKASVIG